MKNNEVANKRNFKTWLSDLKYKFLNNFKGRKQLTDFGSKLLIYFFGMLTVIILLVLVGFIIYKSVYFFQNYAGGFWGFLSGGSWIANNNDFGIWKIIISTFFVLLFSLAIAIPLTIFSSLFICEYLSSKWKCRVIGIVQLLAGIPSVVFGLFALSILGPLFMLLGAPAEANLLVTSITLAFMGLPIMISLSINAIDNVPDAYRFGSLALGLSKTNTTYRIVFRSAYFKIITAVMMGMARIIGETMAVMMICGNAPNGLKLNSGFLNFIFSSIATLASTIGLEMLENSGPMHESALYAIGLILFMIVCVINIIVVSSQTSRKHKITRHTKRPGKPLVLSKEYSPEKINGIFYKKIEKKRRWSKVGDGIGIFFMISSTVIVVAFTLTIIISIIVKGLFGMVWHDLISTSTYSEGAGILATFLVTLLLVICSMIFAIPLSMFVAIYLNEYAQPTSFLTKAVRFAIDVLASTPSIIYGTFGLAFFIGVCRLPLSILAAGLTLTIVILPIMIRSIEDSISGVDNALRQASLALGASKTATTVKVVIPNALPGIMTAIILAMGRIIGESAPVYLTLGTAVRLPIAGFMSPGASMTTEILMLWKEGATADAMRVMYELAFVIMVLILIINGCASLISKKFAPDYHRISFKEKWKLRIKLIKNFNYKEYYLKKINNLNYYWKKITAKFRRRKNKKDQNQGE